MGVLVAIVVLILLVYKKIPPALAAIIGAVIICLLSGLDTMSVMKNEFMTAAGNYVKSWFLLFLLCGIFAEVMKASGAASSIGKWLANLLGPKGAILGVSFATLVLTYGGISCFVVVFTMYPIALVLFKEANIDRRLIPGAIGAGAFTLPNIAWGSPGVCNIIPGTFFGTSATDAGALGLILGIIIYGLANVYLILKNKSLQKKGIGFVPTEKQAKALAYGEGRPGMNPWYCLIPMAIIIITLNIIKLDVLIAVFCGIVSGYVLFWKHIENKTEPLLLGTGNGINSTMSVAPIMGFGTVANMTPAFSGLTGAVTNIKTNPYIAWALAVLVITGITGSGSGGATLSCQLLADKFIAMDGLNPALLAKICSCGCIVLDTMPWNGVICLTMAACECNHKDSYFDLFMITVLINGVSLVLCTAYACLFG